MAKISKTRRGESKEVGDIFDHFNTPMSGHEEKEEEEKSDDVSVKDLLQKITQLEADNRAWREQQQYQQPQIVYAQPQYQAPMQQSEPEDVPDPVTEPKEYARWLVSQTNKAWEEREKAREEQYKQQQSTSNAANELWNDFQGRYENLKDYPKQVAFAAKEAAEKARMRGAPVDRYMANREVFFKDVVEEMKQTFPHLFEEKQVEDDDVNRTMGIFGGMESGNKPGKAAKDQPGDMIKDLKDIQRASGFF